jgi:hypothetical protein
LLTILLAMNPEIKPRTIQPIMDMCIGQNEKVPEGGLIRSGGECGVFASAMTHETDTSGV